MVLSKTFPGPQVCRLALQVCLTALLCLPPRHADAQITSGTEMLQVWANEQRSRIERLTTLSVQTNIRHEIDIGSGSRVASYAAIVHLEEDDLARVMRPPGGPGGAVGPPGPPFRGPGPGPGGPPPQAVDRTLLWMTLDGDTLDAPQARRILRRLHTMLQPVMSRMMNDIGLHAMNLSRIRPNGHMEDDVLEGRPVKRITVSPGGERGRPERAVFWFTPDGSRLLATRILFPLPDKRRLIANTRYARIDGLDVPLDRRLEGAIPVMRRSRRVTVLLDHRTSYSNYEFRFKLD